MSLDVYLWAFSPPCSRALCSSRVNTTKKFEHTSQSVAMYQFEATDVPSSNLSDQITQQHTADGRGISEDTYPFFERAVTLKSKSRRPFWWSGEAASFMPCTIWQVSEKLQILSGLDSILFIGSNKLWRTWRGVKATVWGQIVDFFPYRFKAKF